MVISFKIVLSAEETASVLSESPLISIVSDRFRKHNRGDINCRFKLHNQVSPKDGTQPIELLKIVRKIFLNCPPWNSFYLQLFPRLSVCVLHRPRSSLSRITLKNSTLKRYVTFRLKLANSMSCMIFGTTGLCGKEILKNVEKLSSFANVVSVTRRPFDSNSVKVEQIVERDTYRYKHVVTERRPNVVFSGLATTRCSAGSSEAFVDVDFGINYDIARAAKEAGTHTFVLISSAGADANSMFLYMKTKGRLEAAVLDLKFPRTIILRPGPLLGQRDRSKGFLNDLSATVFRAFHGTFLGRNIIHPIYGSEVGRVAVFLALMPLVRSEKPVVKVVNALAMLHLADSIAYIT